jgi:hypothetical protein
LLLSGLFFVYLYNKEQQQLFQQLKSKKMKTTGSAIFNPAHCPDNWSGKEKIQMFWTVEHCPTTGTVANIESLEHVSCSGKEAIAESCFLEYYGKSAKAIIENQIKTAA